MKSSIRKFLLLVLMMTSCVSRSAFEISEASRKFAVVTPSYGVLNGDDIDIYAWRWNYSDAKPVVFGEYWACFKKSEIRKMECREFDYDALQNEHNAELEILISDGKRIHDIGARRALDVDVCRKTIFEFKKLLKDEAYFCMGLGFGSTSVAPSGIETVGWFYDKFKTKKGCTSYFGEYCNPNYWKDFGYPDRKYTGDRLGN